MFLFESRIAESFLMIARAMSNLKKYRKKVKKSTFGLGINFYLYPAKKQS